MTPPAMTSAGRTGASGSVRGPAGPSASAAPARAPRPVRAGGAQAPRPVRAGGSQSRSNSASRAGGAPVRTASAAAARTAVPRPTRGPATHAPRPTRSTLTRVPRRVSGPVRSTRTQSRPALPHRLALGTAEFFRTLPDHRLVDRLVRGRAWIPVLGVLLAGIVATQVEVLKLGASMGRWMERSAALTSHNQSLQASVATLSDDQRIERLAARMGMVMPAPTAVTFLPRHPAGGARAAMSKIHSPDPAQFLATLQAQAAAAAASSPPPPPATTTPSASGSTAGTVSATATGTTTAGAPTAAATPTGATPTGATTAGATSGGAAAAAIPSAGTASGSTGG